MMEAREVLLDIQEQIFNAKSIRTDVHYTVGEGAVFIREGMELHPQNIIINIPEHVILNGSRVTINFQ